MLSLASSAASPWGSRPRSLSRVCFGFGVEGLARGASLAGVKETMTPKSPFLAKCATPCMAEIIAEAGELRPTWLLDVRTVLGLKQPQMAALLATPLRTYQRWEKDPRWMLVGPYRRAEALLEQANCDSRGRIKIAIGG